MTPLLVLLFALSVACDVGGQLCFKHGVNQGDHEGKPMLTFWLHSLKNPWLLAGVVIYVIEVVTWLQILERAPLSLAFPIASLNYCGILLASRFILGETVTTRRWLGALMITLGVIIIGAGA